MNPLTLGSVNGLYRLNPSGSIQDYLTPIFQADENDPNPDPNIARFNVNFPMLTRTYGHSSARRSAFLESTIPLYMEYDIVTDRIKLSLRNEIRTEPNKANNWHSEFHVNYVSIGDGTDPSKNGFDFTPDSIVTALQNFGQLAIRLGSFYRVDANQGFRPEFSFDSNNDLVMRLEYFSAANSYLSGKVKSVIDLKALAYASDPSGLIDSLQMNAVISSKQWSTWVENRFAMSGWIWTDSGSTRPISWLELEQANSFQLQVLRSYKELGAGSHFSGIFFADDGFYAGFARLGSGSDRYSSTNTPVLHFEASTGLVKVYEGTTEQMTFGSWISFRDFFYLRYSPINDAPSFDAVTLVGNTFTANQGGLQIRLRQYVFGSDAAGWIVEQSDGASSTVGQVWPSFRAYAEYWYGRSGVSSNNFELPDPSNPGLSAYQPSANSFWIHGMSGGRSGWVHINYDPASGMFNFATYFDDLGVAHGVSGPYSSIVSTFKAAMRPLKTGANNIVILSLS